MGHPGSRGTITHGALRHVEPIAVTSHATHRVTSSRTHLVCVVHVHHARQHALALAGLHRVPGTHSCGDGHRVPTSRHLKLNPPHAAVRVSAELTRQRCAARVRTGRIRQGSAGGPGADGHHGHGHTKRKAPRGTGRVSRCAACHRHGRCVGRQHRGYETWPRTFALCSGRRAGVPSPGQREAATRTRRPLPPQRVADTEVMR